MANSAHKILANYDTAGLKSKLLQLPDEIHQLRETRREHYELYRQAEQKVTLLEADMVTDIAAEKDPDTNKPAFANEKARAAELTRRKQQSPDYQQAERKYRSAAAALSEVEDKLEHVQNDYRSYRYVTELVAAELRLLAAYEQPGGATVELGAAKLSPQEAAAANNIDEDY